jgi:phosphatidyl-myo-inositol dimannoside synthase
MNVDERIDTQRYRVTIFATDFKPMMGGVAEYTYHVAKELNRLGALDRVVTPNPQIEDYGFAVVAPSRSIEPARLQGQNILVRKLYSLSYLAQLYTIEAIALLRQKLTTHKTLAIINWIESPLAKRWVSLLQSCGLSYGIILHGKDLLVATKTDRDRFIKACQKSAILIFNSAATLNLFRECHPTIQTPTYILHPGIDIANIDCSSAEAIDSLERKLGTRLSDRLLISTVARLVERKGIDTAIHALAPILAANPQLLYAIGGDGEEYASLAALIETLQLNAQIKLLGNITAAEKSALLQASSIFLMPNHRLQGEDFEGFGISFIEAAFFGNVAIGGRSGGAVEAIQDRKTGFLIDTDTDEAIERLRQLLNDLLGAPERMKSIAECARQYVIDNFQASDLVDKFAEHLNAPNERRNSA